MGRQLGVSYPCKSRAWPYHPANQTLCNQAALVLLKTGAKQYQDREDFDGSTAGRYFHQRPAEEQVPSDQEASLWLVGSNKHTVLAAERECEQEDRGLTMTRVKLHV